MRWKPAGRGLSPGWKAGRMMAPTTPWELQSCPWAANSWKDLSWLAGWVGRRWRRGGGPGPAIPIRGAEARESRKLQPQRSAAVSRMAASPRPEGTPPVRVAERKEGPHWLLKAGWFELAAA